MENAEGLKAAVPHGEAGAGHGARVGEDSAGRVACTGDDGEGRGGGVLDKCERGLFGSS